MIVALLAEMNRHHPRRPHAEHHWIGHPRRRAVGIRAEKLALRDGLLAIEITVWLWRRAAVLVVWP